MSRSSTSFASFYLSYALMLFFGSCKLKKKQKKRRESGLVFHGRCCSRDFDLLAVFNEYDGQKALYPFSVSRCQSNTDCIWTGRWPRRWAESLMKTLLFWTDLILGVCEDSVCLCVCVCVCDWVCSCMFFQKCTSYLLKANRNLLERSIQYCIHM